MRNNNGLTIVALTITIIVIMIIAGVSAWLVFGENGILTKATVTEVEYNKSEVLEELNIIITEIYLEVYNSKSASERTNISEIYNGEVVIEKLKEKNVIQGYKDSEGKNIENKYYISVKELKRDITKHGMGENGTDTNIFTIELKDNEYTVNYYDNNKNMENIGNLQIEQKI